jgi:hypothetical protein
MEQHSDSGKRTAQQLSESLHQRFNSYALAASAAGVSLLALAQPAEGKVVYTKTHQSILPNTHYSLDLNNDGITDFTISDFFRSKSKVGFVGLFGIPDGNAAWGYTVGCTGGSFCATYASALPTGIKIPAKKHGHHRFMTSEAGMVFSNHSSKGGLWLNVTNRYLGLKFVITGETHYGWARLNVSCVTYQCTALLTGYAYETVPGKPIITGKTHGPDVITIQDASLGHLARGASAMQAWRAAHSAK